MFCGFALLWGGEFRTLSARAPWTSCGAAQLPEKWVATHFFLDPGAASELWWGEDPDSWQAALCGQGLVLKHKGHGQIFMFMGDINEKACLLLPLTSVHLAGKHFVTFQPPAPEATPAELESMLEIQRITNLAAYVSFEVEWHSPASMILAASTHTTPADAASSSSAAMPAPDPFISMCFELKAERPIPYSMSLRAWKRRLEEQPGGTHQTSYRPAPSGIILQSGGSCLQIPSQRIHRGSAS